MLSNIKSVEIEIHSLCNRRCQWCPNIEFKRDKKHIMDENIYLKALHELNDNHFNGVISYSRYNEPMYDIELLKLRTKQAKEILPHIKLVTNTNGDYLTRENLEGLYIDELSIMDYDCKGLECCYDKLKEIGITIKSCSAQYIYGQFNDMKIVYCIDWPKHAQLENRGGFLNKDIKINNIELQWKNDKQQRVVSCHEPEYFIAIDYNGNVTPCCHIRSDNPNHEKYILGNINNSPLVNIYYGSKAINFRAIMSSDNYNKYFDCCKYCQKEPGRYTRNNPGINF